MTIVNIFKACSSFRHLWHFKTVFFLHRCLTRVVLLINGKTGDINIIISNISNKCGHIFSFAILYDNKYASIINIYFYEYFHWSQTSSACASKHFRHPVWHLVKCLRFSLIKIESVSIFQAKPRLVPSSQSVVYTFLLKMLSLVWIKN